MTTQTAAAIWRKYVTDGVPGSGPNQPDKAQISAWGTYLESLLNGSAAGLAYATAALLAADLAHAANTLAIVYNDSTSSNNGMYVKSDISGAGAWTRIGDLPNGLIRLTVTGGTGNAIVATAPESPSLPGAKLYLLTTTASNTGATTIEVNGAAAVPIKNAFDVDLASGSLLNGSQVLMAWKVDHYQLLISAVVDGTAILASVTAQATAAAASASSAALSASALVNQVYQYDTQTLATAATIPGGVNLVRVLGDTAAGVGIAKAGLYKRVVSLGAGLLGFQSADGAWWQITDYQLPAKSVNASGGSAGNATTPIPYISKMSTFEDLVDFGIKYDWDQVANSGSDQTTAVQNAISDVRGLLRVSGKVLVNDTLNIPGDMIVQGNGRSISGFVFKTGYSSGKHGLVITSGGLYPYDGGRRGRGMYNFGIFMQSGTSGNVPLVIDTNDGRFVNNYTIDGIMVDALWGSNKSLLLTSGGNDGFFSSTISNCSFFGGGLDLTDVGDSVRVLFNTITAGSFHGVYIKPVAGAAQFLGMGNNCTTNGGSFTAIGASEAKWIYNQCEQIAPYVGSFNAMVTLSGSASCDIIGNNLNARDFCNCVNVTAGSTENFIDLNTMNVQTATPRYHYNATGATTNELGERNRYSNHNSGSILSLRSAAYSKDVNSHTRGLPSGPITLSNGWTAGTDVTFADGLFATRYGRQVRLDGQITGGTVTAGTLIAQLPNDHWPTQVRRVPVIVDNAGTWSMGVVNINTIGQVNITVAFAGNTLVHFDGTSFEI